jgi:hypothetical protein
MSRHPFDDRLEKPAENNSIRLISEGGNSLARSPEPVCFETMQVVHTCTTESQHTYRSSSGICTRSPSSDSALFSVPLEHASALDQGGIPEGVRRGFKQQGFPLSETASITVQQPERAWAISDRDRSYTIKKFATSLAVYKKPR